MNARTAKLISRYASRISAKPRALKREWNELSRKEKARRRPRMKAALG
ncbi:MAG TPA: hypothetical protein VGW35_04140 [Methylomirabilota bacterium]|jgi:hypothetical protein|nr:hypothetical protein [Methylomirabilota bacterium]